MAHNIITSNDLSTHANASLQTTTRPILVQYKHSPNDSTPKPILVQLDIYIEKNGIFVLVGSTQVSSKDFDSTSTNTVFTFDISSILQSQVSSGFYESIFTTNTISAIDFKNTSANQNYKSVVRYKTLAKAWYLNSNNVITLNEVDAPIENPASSGFKFAADLFFKNKELSNSKYVNLPTSSGFVISDEALIPSAKFLTNCPTSIRRKIALDMPFCLSVLHLGTVGESVDVRCQNFTTSTSALSDCGGIIFASETNATINTKNLTLNDSYLFLQTNAKLATTKPNLSFLLRNASNEDSVSVNFEIFNNEYFGASGSNNANLSSLNKDATSIYFINDYGVLDYFMFDSNLDIINEHSKTTFKTGYKDYTSRTSSNTGVSSGKTTEIHSCYSYVNRETSEWLSEIHRSKEVYLYERDTKSFVPIIVLEGETQPSFADPNSVQPFSISFLKDTHVIKK
jgi:hypothetical protein